MQFGNRDSKPGKLSKPIRLFSTGWVEDAKGREYFGTEQLDRIVKNFETLSKGWTANNREQRLHNPAVYIPASVSIGHDEDQSFAKALLGRSDNPAAGWVTRMWRSGDFLMGEVENVPPEVKREIDEGRLRTWSAEIYRNFKDDSGKEWGPAFRRLAFLGGDIPKRKDLGTLPPVILMSESGPGTLLGHRNRLVRMRDRNLLLCFSEGYTVDRNAMLAALQQAGMDTSWVTDAVPDAVLAAAVKGCAPVVDNSEPPSPDGKPPVKCAEPPTPPNDPAKFSEAVRPILESIVAPLRTEIHNLKAERAKEAADAANNEVAVFCETMVKDGRLAPADKDREVKVGQALRATNPDLYKGWHEGIASRKPLVAMHSEQVKAGTGHSQSELNRLRRRMGLAEKN